MSHGLLRTNPFDLLRRHSRLRLAVTLLCLLACTLQSFIAQTHVHVRFSQAPASPGYHAAIDTDADSIVFDEDEHSSKQRNGHEGSSPCPLCQIVLHGGAAPPPTFALSTPLPIAIAVARYEQEPSGTLVAVSFNWQGRAPPLT